MKGRVDSTKIWRDPSAPNGPASQEMPGTGTKMDAEVKAEVKDEDGRKSTDSRPPSRKLNNGDSDIGLSIKAEDNNNKRLKLDKKSDSIKSENGKPGSVGSDSQKVSPASSTPQLSASGANTPATLLPHGSIVTSSEPPFMQQQSEIFVFSTTLANQAADSVHMGHCKTIIQFHMDHPNTKAFLQKNPLKSNNFRPGMSHGGPMGPTSQGMMRMHGPPCNSWGPAGPMEDPAMMGGPGGMMPGHPYPPNSGGPRMMGGWGPCGGPHPHQMGPGNFPPGSLMEMENEYMMGNGPMNISSSQVPDENLTSEQRQHRSKGLAQLTKIHQMLMGANGLPENPHGPMIGPDGRPTGPGGMYPGGMPPGGMMTSQQQQAMMSQQQAMMSQGGMMPPHGMMSPQQQQQHHQHMMAQQGMSPYGPRGPGPCPPGMNGKEQYHAQHEWFQIQQEYYMEKQQQQRMQHMRGGPGPHMEPGPPPSYYSSISRKHGGSPTSPNMNGMRMPMGPHGPPMGPGMDPESMAMYGGPPEMCRGPHMGMDPMAPGMHGYPPHHGMPPQGPMDPGFDPTMAGAMPPGMSPGGPRHQGPMPPQGHPHHMMGGPNGMMVPGHAKTPSQVTLHRAGNPEQFNPETMGGVIPPVMPPNPSTNTSSKSKPPPSYAQAQKRKRDDLDDYSKGNLQQTPSPTKIQYHLNQFEGQELTITKQLNAAYVAGNGGDDSMCPGGHFNSHSNSPLHGGPASNKGPMSNSSQASAHLSSPPIASTACPSPMTVQPPHSTPSASSGANMRLSHFDPQPMPNGVNGAQHMPNSKAPSSSLSNITSASLANLAKGVENLSNQMQQNMMQGGPFHSIQVHGQMSGGGGAGGGGNTAGSNVACSNPNTSSSGAPNVGTESIATTTAVTTTSPSFTSQASAVPAVPSSASTPSVNNTYIATNMSISQVNVPNHPGMNSYVNMQMQNMNTNQEAAGHNMPPGAGGPSMNQQAMMGGPHGPAMTHQMSQSQAMMGSMGPNPGMHPSQGPIPNPGPMHQGGVMPLHGPNPNMPPHGQNPNMPPTPPIPKGSPFTSPPLSHPHMTGSQPPSSGGVTSPQFPPSSSNSSVQIQQKGHNTIQYLPANPPASNQAPAAGKPRPDIDYSGMPRFPSPHPAMDGKNQQQAPPSTLQYFPNSSPTGPRPPMSSSLSASMGAEFANQATIAMHQSAAMRSPSLPDMTGAGGPPMAPSMGHMESHPHAVNSMSGHSPMMRPGPDPMMRPGMDPMMRPGPDPMMRPGPDAMMMMGPGGAQMRHGHSPGVMRPMHPVMGSGSLECVSPIPGMGGYMNNGPTIEQAQAQAQAHAAMMMQGNTPMPGSSPHGPGMAPGGPSPHMPHTPMSMHGPTIPTSNMPGMPGSSPHGPAMSSVSSPHGTAMPMGASPHGPSMVPGPSPHGPMPPVPSPHGHMGGPSPHSAIPGGMSPHGSMGPMHGQSMPPGSMPRHPGMGVMRMPGPTMGGMPQGPPGQYGNMQYPQYQDFYHPQSRAQRQMVPGMMGGPQGQPYGMMPNMQGPS